jgi:phosphoribosylanthranilate isomerase
MEESNRGFGDSLRVRVKICGITCVEDGLQAARAGADFLGYVFYGPSRRFVRPATAARVIESVRRTHPSVQHVGVFVNELHDAVLGIAKDCHLDFVQLAGDETPDTCSWLKDSGAWVIKTLKFGAGAPPVAWQDYPVDYYLCDTFDPKLAGGSGRTFDHSLLPDLLPLTRCFMAGGLDAANVGEVVRARPFAVDVSSSVESGPGRKSPELVSGFIEAVRRAATVSGPE